MKKALLLCALLSLISACNQTQPERMDGTQKTASGVLYAVIDDQYVVGGDLVYDSLSELEANFGVGLGPQAFLSSTA